MSISSEEIRKIANRIEEELFKLFKDTSNKYKNKYRSLIFNLKDSKNQGLFRKVVNGKISPERLVQMSAEELASSELAKWREREKISMLEMIKRDAADKVNQVIVKKTHKGEEVIESTIVNESPLEPKIGKILTKTCFFLKNNKFRQFFRWHESNEHNLNARLRCLNPFGRFDGRLYCRYYFTAQNTSLFKQLSHLYEQTDGRH